MQIMMCSDILSVEWSIFELFTILNRQTCLQDFEEGPWKHNNLDNGANMIIPVPKPLGGAIVLGEAVITYFNKNQLKTVSLPQNVITVQSHPSLTLIGLPCMM